MNRIIVSTLAALALAVAVPATAQDYPDRTVTIVVPYAPGGIADIAARTLGDALSRKWDQEVVVDNRTGGAGFIAAATVKRAPPDGYTLFVADAGVLAVNGYLFESVPYNAAADFKPVTMISDTPLVLVANSDAPFDTPEEYVAHAKQNPGTISYASAGIGSLNHIVPEWINAVAGIDAAHIPFRGGAPAATAVASGEAQVGVLSLSSIAPFVESGELKILGLARDERVDNHPDVPTLDESGIPGVAAGQWAGLVAPAGVPDEVFRKITEDSLEFLRSDEAREAFAERGAIVSPMEPGEFAALIETLRGQFSDVIAEAGISAD